MLDLALLLLVLAMIVMAVLDRAASRAIADGDVTEVSAADAWPDRSALDRAREGGL